MSRDLVTIAHFNTVIEAEMAKSRLESEGVLSFLGNAGAMHAMPFLGASGGVALSVADDDAVRAQEILGIGEEAPAAGPYRTPQD